MINLHIQHFSRFPAHESFTSGTFESIGMKKTSSGSYHVMQPFTRAPIWFSFCHEYVPVWGRFVLWLVQCCKTHGNVRSRFSSIVASTGWPLIAYSINTFNIHTHPKQSTWNQYLPHVFLWAFQSCVRPSFATEYKWDSWSYSLVQTWDSTAYLPEVPFAQ